MDDKFGFVYLLSHSKINEKALEKKDCSLTFRNLEIDEVIFYIFALTIWQLCPFFFFRFCIFLQ